jgi:hypothetical protein
MSRTGGGFSDGLLGNKQANKPGPRTKGLLGSAQSYSLFIRRTFEKTLAHEREGQNKQELP